MNWLDLATKAALLGTMPYAHYSEDYRENRRIQRNAINTLNWCLVNLREMYPIDERTTEQNAMIAEVCYEIAMLANFHNYQGHFSYVI